MCPTYVAIVSSQGTVNVKECSGINGVITYDEAVVNAEELMQWNT